MGEDGNEKLDAQWIREMKSAGVSMSRLDSLIRSQEESCLMERTKISLKSRGGGWLCIVETVINGQKFVQFRDLGNLTELGKTVSGMIADPSWKVQKPFEQRTLTGIDKST